LRGYIILTLLFRKLRGGLFCGNRGGLISERLLSCHSQLLLGVIALTTTIDLVTLPKLLTSSARMSRFKSQCHI
jgi:hypothetical protein